MSIRLIFGGARSGKSAYTKQLAAQFGKEVLLLTTAHAGDAQMPARGHGVRPTM